VSPLGKRTANRESPTRRDFAAYLRVCVTESGKKTGGGETRFPSYIYTPLVNARESRDWSFRVRGERGPGAGDARLSLLATIIKVLIALVTRARERSGVRRAAG